MSKLTANNLRKLSALSAQQLPNGARLIARITLFAIFTASLVLWFTPWIQTAPGAGYVSALNPDDRIQSISALVSGQIGNWHVQEGQAVTIGDPIVTIVDIDNEILDKMNAEKAAVTNEYEANLLATETAKIDLERRKSLFEQGLASKRDIEKANINFEKLKAKQAETLAKIKQVDVRLSRLSSQTKYAPKNGTITRLKAGGKATYVKFGEELATFIPDDIQRAVVIQISGMDAPLVRPQQKVRLQFEGWPVLQLSGWPSTAVGTFGGLVKFIEPVTNINGSFNVWITQDTKDAEWPQDGFVSLGSKVKGWILLNEVSLGYEIWRQLNSFPPEYPAETTKP